MGSYRLKGSEFLPGITKMFQKWIVVMAALPGASVRNSAHGKGHEEGGLAYAKA